MNDTAIHALLQQHWSDISDVEKSHEIYHSDAVLEFPQSGETIRGLDNIKAMRGVYPAAVTITGQRTRGHGHLWVTEVLVAYDGGDPMHAVNIMEFRDGRVGRETIFFGDPFPASAWRTPWVDAPS